MGIGYKDLEIYQLSHKLAVEIHEVTIDELGRKIYNFIKSVESGHRSTSKIQHQTSNIKHPKSNIGKGEGMR